ncbi:MAG: hypothetical protein Q8Q25_03400 [bacterium]|nr:hypothetical protein [bacterium]
MTSNIRKLLLSNASLKVLSFIFGYTLWYIFSNEQVITVWKTVPLCFYSVPSQWTITGPDSVSIQLTGKRSHIYTLERENLAAHINTQNLQPGEQCIKLTSDTLFLPDSIKLVHYVPSNLHVTIEESQNKE